MHIRAPNIGTAADLPADFTGPDLNNLDKRF